MSCSAVAARRGGKCGQNAVAHCLLVAAWHVLATRTPYHDLGVDYFLSHRPTRTQQVPHRLHLSVLALRLHAEQEITVHNWARWARWR